MKYLIYYSVLFLFMFIFPFTSAGQINSPCLKQMNIDDLKLGERHDYWENDYWMTTDSSVYYYDANNLLVEKLKIRFVDSLWHNFYNYNYFYDDNQNVERELLQKWEEDVWIDNLQHTFEYDINNNILLDISQIWDDSIWKNSSKHAYEYDENNNLIFRVQQTWNDSMWVNFYKYENQYDENGLRIFSYSYPWYDSNWVISTRHIYTYDDDGKKILSVRQSWETTFWENISRWIIEYEDELPIQYLGEHWDGISWFNYWLDIHEYDTNGNLIKEYIQKWDGDNWINAYMSYFYFDLMSNLQELDKPRNILQIYPNPSNGKFSIGFEGNDILKGYVNVYNSEGQIIYSLALTGANERLSVDLTKHPNGNYIIQAIIGDKQFERILIIAH